MTTTYITADNGEEITIPRFCGKLKATVLSFAPTIKQWGKNWNGYGYADKFTRYTITAKQFAIIRAMTELPKKATKRKTESEKIADWCKRLVKLSGITYEDAQEIAQEKIDYKQEQIDELEERQEYYYSRERAKLIREIERSSPLRRIENEEHARAILAASNRHNNSNYENLLEYGRELAERGEIDKSEVRDFARQNTRYYS